MSLSDYHDSLIELRNEDISYKEIAEQLGYKRDTIKHYCQRNDIRGIEIDNSLEAREKKYIKQFNKKFPDFEYMSGYEKYDSTIKVKCKKCGHVQERNAHGKVGMICDNCIEIGIRENLKAIEKQRVITILIKLLDKQRKQLSRELSLCKVCQRCGEEYVATYLNNVHCSDCIESIKEKQNSWKDKEIECLECGQSFTMSRIDSKYCSDACKRRMNNRINEINRRHKLKENGKIDYSISLKKLYKKDKGTCHICGEKCNPKDYIKDGNVFIAGGTYPSIDHVYPVAKGGTHTWDNIKLAHRWCNTIKKDKIVYKESGGQLRII